MALEQSRIVEAGETPHAHEREGLDFALSQLPNTDPYHAWTLCELIDPSTGRLYEIDLIVLGYSALYLVELKAGPGRYVGDGTDWHRLPPEGGPARYMDPPLRLTNHKAKVLKGRLEKKMQGRAPWIEPLVFLSAPEDQLDIDLREDGRVRLITRSTFRNAVTNHKFLGADDYRKPQRISAPEMADIVRGMAALGLRRRKGQAYAGQYALGEVLLDGPGFQDRRAQHRSLENMRRRARVYLVPQQTSVERRQQLRRAAEREAQLLYGLREHPHILSFIDHETDAPLGPTVLFDDFEGGIPLPAFLRQHPELTLAERAEIICQIGRALHFCHQKNVVHRALSPDAVLVRRHPDDDRIDTRLFNFQLAEGERASATMHWSQLASDPWALYQAPELREDPTRGSELTDTFSLGALAYFTFTGKEPAASLAELNERLERDGWLDIGAVVDHVPAHIVDMVREATARVRLLRTEKLFEWIETLAGAVADETEGAAAESDVSPLEARADAALDGLIVKGVLGHGATSRVLHVVRNSDGKNYALKVSLSDDHDERLREEAAALAELRHARIVELVEGRTIGGRFCLLLSLAGDATLQSYLAKEGSVSLDYAARFGEDLLSALEYLQEAGVVHRDIKPANVGVGSLGKKGVHLTLFDFSLVNAAPTNLQVGTLAYRDPFLSRRGVWDLSADRFSAAVCLHEMVTGVRPSLANGSGPLDADAEIVLSAERFDPSVRTQLTQFFSRALAREVDARFDDARQMRIAWERVFRADSEHPGAPSTAPEPTEAAEPGWTAKELALLAPDAPLERLPLSARARNALDRAGITVAGEIMGLPENRLSAVRGVGQLVSREIATFRAAWAAHHSTTSAVTEPFVASYRGEDMLAATSGLDAELSAALHDAGLRTLRSIAEAPRAHVQALAKRHGISAALVHELLALENKRAGERDEPTTLEGWIDSFLPPSKSKKPTKYVLAMFGLEAPFEGRLDATGAEVARHFEVTAANVYISLAEHRARWQERPALAELRAMVRTVLAEGAGALPLARAAAVLVARIAHEAQAASALSTARAAALVRIVAEVDKDVADGISLARLHDVPWLVVSEAHAKSLRALGAACDALADRAVLAPWSEVARVLESAAAAGPFAALGADVLARLGTDVSPKAACSARQEIYPSGMPAARALELCAAQLRGPLSSADVAQRVLARYPEAAPLPSGPSLEALLARHNLVLRRGTYVRASDHEAPTSVQTNYSSLPKDIDEPAADFDARVRRALERGGLRMVGVRLGHAEAAALALAKRVGVTPVDLSRALVGHMRILQREAEMEADVLDDADIEGPRNPGDWSELRALANEAAKRLALALLGQSAPLVLVQPGLFARYGLNDFSEQLRAAIARDETRAIFVVVPSRDQRRVPQLEGWSLADAKPMWMPESWVSAATAAG